jgi:arginase
MEERKWEIIGAPFDFGSSHKGSGKAPEAIRSAGLARRIRFMNSLGIDVVDGGDVEAPSPVSGDEPNDTLGTVDNPTGLVEMIEYAPRLMARLDSSLKSGNIPLVLGGDHSITIPTVSAVADYVRRSGGRNASVGLIWVDAHPDIETPGEDSTNDLNAMPVSHLLGLGIAELRGLAGFEPKVRPEHLVLVGAREVVPEEKKIIRDMNITAYTATDIERLGILQICETTFNRLEEVTDAVVISFDIDAIDPSVAPAVDYPEQGGLTFREAMVVMEFAARSEKLALFELVEVNPAKDSDHATSKLALGLIHHVICGPLL